MCQLKFWVLMLGVAVNGAVGRSVSDSQSDEDVGIIGGDDVDITQYPHQVSLVFQGRHICGGSIISEEYVLTAAHCVDKKSASDFQVRTGSTYRTEGGVLHDVASITQHPKYNVGQMFDYDIALLKIAGNISIDGETTKIVKLADSGSKLKHGDVVTVTGWGYTNWSGMPSHVLKAASLPIVENEQCNQIFEGGITDRMVCAGMKGHGQSACRGDSGGPLIDSNSVQHGIVSFGYIFCELRPAVFASVGNLRSWIKEKTGV